MWKMSDRYAAMQNDQLSFDIRSNYSKRRDIKYEA